MQAPVPADDRKLIAQTIETYVQGAREGSSATMRRAFHEVANICGHLPPDLFGGPVQILFDWQDENPPSTNVRHEVAHLEVFETIATARVEIWDWKGHRFTDMFTLLKTGEVWQIVSKVFHLHPE